MSKKKYKRPKELPKKPVGWTRKMTLHMNFGSEGGAGTFDVFDPDGHMVEFGYQYDTRKDGLTGFSLPDIEGVLTWTQLRAKWPEWIKSHPEDKS